MPATPHSGSGHLGLLTSMVRRFAVERVRPIAADLDATERFPEEIYREMGRLGLLGITIPEASGGSGGSCLDYAVVMEELAHGYSSVADQCGLVEMVASLLAELGTPQQKERYLPGLLAGTRQCAYALTEPEAGSDLSSIRTVARHTSDGWLLNGEKVLIHNAPVAHFALVLAVTDRAKGRRGGMSMFLVDTDLPGVRRPYREHKMGQRASPVGGFAFEQVLLASEALLGTEGAGYGAVLRVLQKGRVGIAALAAGIIRAALDASVAYATTRIQFGRPLRDYQAIAFPIADMACGYRAARLLIDHAARSIDEADPEAGTIASMAKLFATEAAVHATSQALQIHGGSGYIRGVEVERLYRDARVTTIYEGTSEIQRLIISKALLRP